MEDKTEVGITEDGIKGAEEPKTRKAAKGDEWMRLDGRTVFLARDIIAQIVLIAHTRPAYIDDKALLAFERADMKRRSKLHEKVEKESQGSDDAHLWG